MNPIKLQSAPDRWEIQTMGSFEEPMFRYESGTPELNREVLSEIIDAMEKKAYSVVIITKNCTLDTYGAPLSHSAHQVIPAIRPNLV